MTIASFRTLYAYNWWANSRLLEASRDLEQTALQSDLGGSYPSLLATWLHTFWVESLFIRRWQGLSTADVSSPPGYTAIGTLHPAWEELVRNQMQFLSTLNDGDCSREVRYVDSRGRSLSLTLENALLHVVNHSTYHRGQAASKLRQLGKTPPSTDFVLYCRDSSA
jgi:uncharacterized damage-inducible protein DinB